MRIGIDCLAIKANYRGGINSYLLGLVDGFKSTDKNNTFVLFCTVKNSSLFSEYKNIDNFELIIIDDVKIKFGKYILLLPLLFNSLYLWEKVTNIYNNMLGLKKIIENNCDILYTPTTVLNFYNLKIPTLLSMHDIQHHHYPEFFSNIRLRWRRLSFKNSAKFTTYFQASSKFIHDDLLTIFNEIKKEQIQVISEGVNIKEFSQTRNIDLQKEFDIPDKFIFFPAQLWKHKNHITVLKALKKLECEGLIIPLVMTGDKYSASDEILNYIKDNDMHYVKYLGKIDFKYLVALYQQAAYLITATLYESSSLPILEAAASSTPIIASNTSPNVEMSQNIKMNLFTPLSIEECSDIIKVCWSNSTEDINDQVIVNNKNIFKYSWDNVASQYIDFIKGKLNVK